MTAFQMLRSSCLAVALGTMTLFSGFALAHDHGEKGPHGGNLIALGDEEFHAEIVVNEKTNTLAIYLLDSTAKKTVVSNSTEAFVNLKHGGKPVQFKLPALPQQTDAAGTSSCFSMVNGELIHDLHHKDNGAVLRVGIAGKTYTGKLTLGAHDHKH
ncbi:hypothetical protein [Planctomicrobium piriforme]|uniref:Uncharacterized protein n=1 Tax=Planctomicrobium piriforme TaxID=1576369 RepID=A0A1I3M1L5_9PLAN|nr:hypothetical protein [Planctomicrobium piriforme]SFI90858.1 hypothetical protein SAMN05421753_113131 [Planctomicrobium piriforme]